MLHFNALLTSSVAFMQSNPVKVESLRSERCLTFSCVWGEEGPRAVPAHRHPSSPLAHRLGVAMFGLRVHPIWMKRAEAAGAARLRRVCLRSAS